MNARAGAIAIPLSLVLMVAFAIAEAWGSLPHEKSMAGQATCVMTASAGLSALAVGQHSRVARAAKFFGAVGVIGAGIFLFVLMPELRN